uniref:Uncharacterized protein n=1 Tax=Globisporangium ultimum (strain ATCC 200006 / CBS 805.95 / DAOM BR144) TaxID=431595 RepID=K3X0K9_GLOUD
MSAYLSWLQKQETKVRRPSRPTTSTTDSSFAPPSPLSSSLSSSTHTAAAGEIKRLRTTAKESNSTSTANDWEKRREERWTTIKERLSKSIESARNAKAPKVDAAGGGKATTLLPTAGSSGSGKTAMDTKKRSLQFVTMRAPTATAAPRATEKVDSRITSTKPNSATYNAKKPEHTTVVHSRKRPISDVEAPSKLSDLPTKHRKVNDDAEKGAFACELDEDKQESQEDKAPTTLQDALASIDKKYGSLAAASMGYGDSASNMVTAQYYRIEAEDEPAASKEIEEVAYWQSIDRFASLY